MPLDDFRIIDSTLREGEQFARARFTLDDKVTLLHALDGFGIEYMEVTSPAASPRSAADCRTLARLPRRIKLLTHVRCTPEDARLAIDAGVDGVNALFGASPALRAHSHGRSVEQIIEAAAGVVDLVKAGGLEARFSCEDAFRTAEEDLLRIYAAVDARGVDRVGLADTVGIATPRQVYERVARVRRAVRCDIEFHGHDDTGCAVANAHAALEAGATHVDTTVLGIGERNGITSLGGLLARLYPFDRAALRGKYRLDRLASLDALVARMVGVAIPFNQCLTGETAFTHKAGIHTKAVHACPDTYEIFDPSDFGRERTILVGHSLTGIHAVGHRAAALGLAFGPEELRAATDRLKRLADERPVAEAEIDGLLRTLAAG